MDEERTPFVLRWVLPFGAVLVVAAMTLMVVFLRQPKHSYGDPSMEARGEHLVFHPSGRPFVILASVQEGRVAVHLPHGGSASAFVEEGSGIPLAELPRRPLYGFFSVRPISVASVMGRLARGATDVPGAATFVFRW